MSVKNLPIISYTLAAMAGICFISGLVILSGEGGVPSEQIGSILDNA